MAVIGYRSHFGHLALLAALLLASCGLLVLLAWCMVRWRAVGRDPAPGTVVVRYTPPPGISPAGLRHIRRMGYDQRCFTADVLALAVAGQLRIERDKRLLKDRWALHRTAGAAGGAPAGPAAATPLLDTLFAKGPDLVLDQDAAERLQKATLAHWKALDRRFKGTMFRNNGGSSLVAVLIAVLFSAAALLLGQEGGLLFALVPIGLMAIAVVVFAFLVRAHTPEGRRLLDEIEGLRRYLGVAERQDLQRLQGPGEDEPELDAGRFEMLLPYAVALDVEEGWTRKFTLAVGAAAAAAATASMAWYHGSGRGAVGDIAGFTRAVGSGLTSQIASSSTPPGSSSGGGGGGFSGGGGGGGTIGQPDDQYLVWHCCGVLDPDHARPGRHRLAEGKSVFGNREIDICGGHHGPFGTAGHSQRSHHSLGEVRHHVGRARNDADQGIVARLQQQGSFCHGARVGTIGAAQQANP